jgi:hypothetical protein
MARLARECGNRPCRRAIVGVAKEGAMAARILLRRRWPVGVLVVAFPVIIVTLALTLEHGGQPETAIKPDAIFGQPDATVLTVRFPIQLDGWCLGRFTISVNETPERVSVGDVIDHGSPAGACKGIGSPDGMHASVDVTLRSPVGQRAIVRASDGVVLPLSTGASEP